MAAPPPEFLATMRNRLEQLAEYISTEANHPSLSLESLIDAFIAVYTDCKAASQQNEQVSGFVEKYDQLATKLANLRINTRDFDTIKTLATGAVGRVCLVRAKKDSKVYAMKILKKSDLLTRREAAFFMEERNALVFSQDSHWITTLHVAFQDEENLYLVMEYVSGGSLRSLLNNREITMPEEEAKFYIAEMILALETIHQYNYIHRDVKPENCLIDSNGHIKLADLGSCIRLTDAASAKSHDTVGTPDYISPEILRAHEGKVTYGIAVDWWSVGVILYELLFDEVPFYSESLTETYGKIMNHEKHFAFPEDIEISSRCKDLIQKLICKQEIRLGRNSTNEIKAHPWFEGLDWDNIRKLTPPFIPELSGPEDTRYFEDEENESKKFAKKPLTKTREFSGQNLPFIGYTYVQCATAQISWPKMAGNGSKATIDGRAGKSSAGGDRLESVSGAISTNEALEEQAKKESQRSAALAASKKSLEEETSSIRAALQRETTQRAEFQASATALEKEKMRLEADFKQLKLSYDRDSHERVGLQEKLQQLKSSIDREMQSKAETQELVEIRKRLERDVASMNAALRDERAQAMKRELVLAEITKARSMIDAEAGRLSKALAEEKHLKDEIAGKADSLEKRIESETARIADLEVRRTELINETTRQAAEIKSLKEAIRTSTEKSNKFGQRSSDLEKEKAMLEIEVESLQSKYQDALTHSEELARNLSDLQGSQQATKDNEIETLRAQLSALTATRNKTMDDLSVALKTRALIEMERNSLKELVKSADMELEDTKTALSSTKEQLIKQDQTLQALEDTRKRLEAKLDESELQIKRLTTELSEKAKHQATLDQTILELTQTNNSLSSELGDMRVKYEHEVQNADIFKARIAELAQSLSEELRARTGFESMHASAQQANEQLTNEIERQRAHIDTIMREHESSINEHHTTVTQLKEERKLLEETLQAEKTARFELEESKVKLNRTIKELHNDIMNEAEARMKNEIFLDDANKRITEFAIELQTASSNEQQLGNQILDLEQLCETLRSKLDAFEEREQQMLAEIKAKSDEKNHSRFKLRGMFFKGSRDSVDMLADRTTQRLQDSEEELRKDTEFKYNQSSQSLDSLTQSVRSNHQSILSPAVAKLPSLVAMSEIFDPNEVLQGWLKVPKGGKVKKGWKIQFAVIRDFKMFMYDRDKDVDTVHGAQFFDMSSEIFLARAVSQNEVIHASAKDVDRIFKVQVWSQSTKDDGSMIGNDIQQRIQKLQTDIELEEKMQQAAEKILGVTTDAQKISVIGQIDASNKRLRALKSELEKLSSRLSSGRGDNSTSPKSSAENVDMASETAAARVQRIEEEAQIMQKELEAQLEDEMKKRDALSKLAQAESRKKHKDVQTKDVEVELLTTDRVIAKLKENLEVINSNDIERIALFLQRMRKMNKVTDSLGHFFVPRQFYKPTDCSICLEPFLESKNQGLECSACKFVCHKGCRLNVDTSCDHMNKLKTIAPIYFLANDIQDRARWLFGLAYMRKEWEKSQHNESCDVSVGKRSSRSEKRYSSIIESPNSKRMSGILSGGSPGAAYSQKAAQQPTTK